MPRSITMAQLGQLMTPATKIIDVREVNEFAQYHLPNAVNIPYQSLVMYPEHYLNPQEVYYIICGHGSVSYRAAMILSSYGYQTVTVAGGYDMRYHRY